MVGSERCGAPSHWVDTEGDQNEGRRPSVGPTEMGGAASHCNLHGLAEPCQKWDLPAPGDKDAQDRFKGERQNHV
jgi:hypothetical protein